MLGDLPPSSRLRRLRLLTAEFCSSLRAVAMLPVKLILSTSSWRARVSPAVGPEPVTTGRAPSGRPAPPQISAKCRALSGVNSEGLRITGQPQAGAGATFQAA